MAAIYYTPATISGAGTYVIGTTLTTSPYGPGRSLKDAQVPDVTGRAPTVPITGQIWPRGQKASG